MWRLPQDPQVDGVVVENQGSSSLLQLFNATWKNSGRYTCEEASSYQSREIDIFIPGQGDRAIYQTWITPIPPVKPVIIPPTPRQVQRNGLSHWVPVW